MAQKRKQYVKLADGTLEQQYIATSADVVEITGTIGGKTVTNVKDALEAVDERYSTILNGLNSKVSANTINQANGVAGLDANGDISTDVLPDSVVITGTDGKIPSSKLPSYVDDVIEGYYKDNKFYTSPGQTTLISGETGKIYVDMYTNKTYRFTSSQTGYVEISASLALGETSSTAYPGDKGKTNAENIATLQGTIDAITDGDTSVGYALNAGSLGGKTAQDYALKTDILSDVSDTGTNPIISSIAKSGNTINVTRRAMTSTDLPNSGVTSGTYSVVTVDAKGRATAGTQLIEWGTSGQTTPSNLAVGGLFMQLI